MHHRGGGSGGVWRGGEGREGVTDDYLTTPAVSTTMPTPSTFLVALVFQCHTVQPHLMLTEAIMLRFGVPQQKCDTSTTLYLLVEQQPYDDITPFFL